MVKKKFLILIALLIILFCAVLASYSLQPTPIDPDEGLRVPEGYRIVNESENYTLMESDKYHTISVSTLENLDKDVLKHMLESSMYDFTYSDSYTKGSYSIEEDWYNQEYQRGIIYFCQKGNELIVIDYKVPVTEDLENSLVSVILDSLG